MFCIFNGDTRQPLANPVEDVLQRGTVVELASRATLLARDGREYRITDSAAPIRDADNAIVGVVLVFCDVTEKFQAEAALHESDERFHRLFSQAGAGLALLDSATGHFLQVNRKFCEIIGYDEADLSELDFKTLTHPEDLQQSLDSVARMRSGQQDGFEMEKRYIHKAGHTVWAKLTLSRMLSPIGARDTDIAVIQDITQRKLAQRETQAMLVEKTALLNEVHHRVKNNLQVISSLLRLESARSDLDETRLLLKSMQSRIQSMALLHETLYRSGTFASVDLGGYIKQLAAQSFRTLLAPGDSIRLVLDVVSVSVSMDQATPCGLLVNELISNALKHGFPDGRAGDVRIVLRHVETDGQTADQLQLSVSDTGVGLPPDFAEKRQNSLGLQLVTSLAQQLGGELQTGPGATFSLVFTIDQLGPKDEHNAKE